MPFPSPGDYPAPGIEPASPALAGGIFTAEPLGKPLVVLYYATIKKRTATNPHIYEPGRLKPIIQGTTVVFPKRVLIDSKEERYY